MVNTNFKVSLHCNETFLKDVHYKESCDACTQNTTCQRIRDVVKMVEQILKKKTDLEQ